MRNTMWSALMANWMPDDSFRPDEKVRRYYEMKCAIANVLRPKSILEIGVRAGYSAFAFLWAVPSAEYFGIDAARGDYADIETCWLHAQKILLPYRTVFLRADTRQMDALPFDALGVPYEFIHVDGDHSEEGCAHDVGLALSHGARWVLVDDYVHIPAVRKAVQGILGGRSGLRTGFFDDGLRGNLLIGRSSDHETWAHLAPIMEEHLRA